MLIKGLLIAIGVNGWQSTQWSNETTHDHPSLRVSTHIFLPNSSSSSASLDRAARVVALFASASMDVDFFCNSALCWTVEILKGRGRPFPIRCHGDKFQRDPRNIQLLLKKKNLTPLLLCRKYIVVWLRGQVAMGGAIRRGKMISDIMHENESRIESCAIECWGHFRGMFYSRWCVKWDWFGKIAINRINFEQL